MSVRHWRPLQLRPPPALRESVGGGTIHESNTPEGLEQCLSTTVARRRQLALTVLNGQQGFRAG